MESTTSTLPDKSNYKRIHLFEFEDFSWFPDWIRKCMTRYIEAFHKVLGSSDQIAGIVSKALQHSSSQHIIDLCSGSGGPMLPVYKKLKETQPELKLTLSDLYPNEDAAKLINNSKDKNLKYETSPVDATKIGGEFRGVRTMICSMHHMTPETARGILEDAKNARQPIVIYEISDNAAPIFIWWIAIPFAFIMTLFFTPLVRPMTWQQIIFTYFIPIIPLFIAWDGAVSNARTYTVSDMDILLQGLEAEDYAWEKGTIKGKGGGKVYLLGLPKK
jgi:hypothetical protein